MALMTRATDPGMHTEQLAGRTQQRFFRPEEEARFTYPHGFEVDFGKRAEFDATGMEPTQINLKLRELMKQGYGTIVLKNPGAKHGIAVGILNRLNLEIQGSLGYFGCGLAVLLLWRRGELARTGAREARWIAASFIATLYCVWVSIGFGSKALLWGLMLCAAGVPVYWWYAIVRRPAVAT